MSTTKDGAVRGRALGRRRDDGSYGIVIAICLPRDELSVPLIRHLVRDALTELGVVDDITEDLLLVLTEACTNVVDHSGPGDEYDVTVTINPERCELRIIDVGHGFDHASVAAAAQDDGLHTERGRGLGLMQLLALLGALGTSTNALLTTPFLAWRGLVREDAYYGPLWQGALVSLGWAVACLVPARLVLLRRDVR